MNIDPFWARLLAIVAAAFVAALVLSSCGSRLPKDMRITPTTLADPLQVAERPGAYTNSTVLWGGRIVSLRPGREGTELEVLQFELNSSDRPESSQRTGGRFLVRTPAFLDPALYAPGREVTVAGTLEGSETRPVGERPYVYPVVASNDVYLWPERAPYRDPYYDPWGPRFYFGYGVYRYW
ncbi:starvation-inducible outer membrane lipoprotein [Desulfocurvibacter africanus PCS]|uniref:Starvation-inducible outer membrane lipoprotein n=1 Tax=Desulfocurvibacter africanus PCS TaxID=1262666 RepID=M5PS76_DESAF|nr:Slp family lipoprotein [Desulfocurvibacter africanus]EMG36915.1 starvation-inducible outer membrane lipoprotein [Desulfocurvibacter africanus PCS]